VQAKIKKRRLESDHPGVSNEGIKYQYKYKERLV
jgi:hypothetical protein